MFKLTKKFSGLSGLCEKGLEGNTGVDANAITAAAKAALANIPEEITGLAARMAVLEGTDIIKTIAELTQLKLDVVGLQGLEAKIPEDRKEEIETMGARLDGISAQILSSAAAPGAAAAPKNLGETIFEDENFQAMIGKSSKGSGTYKIKLNEHAGLSAFGSVRDILSGVSAAPVLAAADLGALRWSTRQTEIVMEPKESVAAFVPAIGVVPAPGFQVYEYLKENADSATGYLRVTLDTALTGATTAVASCDVSDASHFVVGSYVRFFNAAKAKLGRLKLVSVDFTSTQNTLTFGAGLIDWDQAVDTNITSERWLGTPEGEGKPYTLLGGDDTSVNAVTIAIMAAATRQQLLSPSGIMAWIQQELPARTRDNIAHELLYGAGTTGKSLMGFWNVTGAQTYAWSEGEVGDNRIDAILRAGLMVLGGQKTVVMNKYDFEIMRLDKDSTGQYLLPGNLAKVTLERGSDGNWVLDGEYTIVKSEAVLDGDFLICDFATASKLIDAEDESIEWGVIDDDFAKNQRRARYELTMAHAVQRLKAFTLGDWDNTPV